MHGPTQALIDSGLTGKNLRQGSINKKLDRQGLHIALISFLHDGENPAIKKVFHDLIKGIIFQFLYGRKSLGEYFTVGTVRSENIVINIKFIGHSYRRSFLSDGKVCRTRV